MTSTSNNTPSKLILPPAAFEDDQELLEWLEDCRKIVLKAADEMDENAAFVFATLHRYARSQGLWGWPAKRTARAASLPLARVSETLVDAAGYFRNASRATEAYAEAVDPSLRHSNNFKVKGRS